MEMFNFYDKYIKNKIIKEETLISVKLNWDV